MFNEYTSIYIQKAQQLPRIEPNYNIYSNGAKIGRAEQRPDPSQKITQRFTILLSILLTSTGKLYLENLKFAVIDEHGSELGTVNKPIGWYKDFTIHRNNGEKLGRIKPMFKMKSPALIVFNADGKEWLKASGGYGATDFSVIDIKEEREISALRRRSLIYESVKDSVFKDEVYHLEIRDLTEDELLALIGMAIIIDIYYHN